MSRLIGVTPLYDYRDAGEHRRLYSTQPNLEDESLRRSAEPICRVWKNPMRVLALDGEAGPIPLSNQ